MGDTTYDNVGGKGEIDRQGIWLYDTWMGDNGHYADYVAKWGHLANDYEIYNHKANKINGEYSNNVLSVSAEYGRKKTSAVIGILNHRHNCNMHVLQLPIMSPHREQK